jgi:glycosyltransferase involved in cell wall biosynthesis
LRIALFHNLPSGGAKRAIYEWVQRLATNHRIDVFTLSSADHIHCDIRPFVNQYRIYDFTPRKLFDSPWGRLNQFQRWRDLAEITRIGHRIAVEIDAGHYDVVLANTCLYTFIPTFVQYVQTPTVYYLHEPFGKHFTRRFQRPYFKSNGLRAAMNRWDPLIQCYSRRLETLQRKSIRRTARLLANSRFTQEQMEVAHSVEAVVCHLGVDCNSFRPMAIMRKANQVISVGELSPRKGFDFLIQSLGRIPPEERPVLRVACNTVDVEERDYVRSLASRLGVDLRVLTNLSSDELTIEYNKARLCVYAPVLEPFGLVPLEAMSCGTPVVGVREGGVEEGIVHEETGLLVERDPTKFATAVRHLLSNPALLADYGCQARTHILRNWTWEKSVVALQNHLTACAVKPS